MQTHMTKHDLPDMRLLAANENINYSGHALDQMFERDITTDDVENVLRSDTNQLIETQSPSAAIGRSHSDERFLIYDPKYTMDIIVVGVLQFVPLPEIYIVTVERVRDEVWDRIDGADPCLVRKMTSNVV